MKKIVLVLACVLGVAGCAGVSSQVSPSAPPSHHEHAFAAALNEAFELYEHEVELAAAMTYGSEAEARAVMQTLSTSRFDWELSKALGRRGLTPSDLASYAVAHPDFFHAQQRAHWGRLAQLQKAVDALPTNVRAVDVGLLAVDLAE